VPETIEVVPQRCFDNSVYAVRDFLQKEYPPAEYAIKVDPLKKLITERMELGQPLKQATDDIAGECLQSGNHDILEWLWAAAADLCDAKEQPPSPN
jgi:hypothetical protein